MCQWRHDPFFLLLFLQAFLAREGRLKAREEEEEDEEAED